MGRRQTAAELATGRQGNHGKRSHWAWGLLGKDETVEEKRADRDRHSETRPGNQGSVDTGPCRADFVVEEGAGRRTEKTGDSLISQGIPPPARSIDALTAISHLPTGKKLRQNSDFSQIRAWMGREPGVGLGKRAISVFTTEPLQKGLVSSPFLPLLHTSDRGERRGTEASEGRSNPSLTLDV